MVDRLLHKREYSIFIGRLSHVAIFRVTVHGTLVAITHFCPARHTLVHTTTADPFGDTHTAVTPVAGATIPALTLATLNAVVSGENVVRVHSGASHVAIFRVVGKRSNNLEVHDSTRRAYTPTL
jgi:hypothetical protein